MTKVHFSKIFGIRPQFLAYNSWNPQNSPSVEKGKGVFYYVNKVKKKAWVGRDGCQEKQPCDWKFSIFSRMLPTPTTQEEWGAGNLINRQNPVN